MEYEGSFLRINDEVYIASDRIVRFGLQDIEFVKSKAIKNIRGRARICAHKTSKDSLHEMLIAIRADSYICPHRHHNKVESLHIIEGCADVIIFSDDGKIIDRIRLGAEGCFYYRLDTPLYHTLLIHSPIIVLHEVTQGPFNPEDADFASFAPSESSCKKFDFLHALLYQTR